MFLVGNYRPRLWFILLLANLTLLAIPFVFVVYTRFFETDIVQRFESLLAGQGALLAVYYRSALGGDVLPDKKMTEEQWKRYPTTKLSTASPRYEFLGTRPAQLDLRLDEVYPELDWMTRRESDGNNSGADPYARDVGNIIQGYIDEMKRAFPGNIRISVIDTKGFVVASTVKSRWSISIEDHVNLRQVFKGEDVRSLHLNGFVPTDFVPRILHFLGMSHSGTRSVVVGFPIILQDRVIAAGILTSVPGTIYVGILNNREWLWRVIVILLLATTFFIVVIFFTVTRPVRHVRDRLQMVVDGKKDGLDLMHRLFTREMKELSGSISKTVNELSRRERQAEAFANHVAHETRTPLTSTIGAVDLLREHSDTMTAEEKDRFLTIIEKDSQRLLSMSEKLIEEGRAGTVRVSKDDQANLDVALQKLKEDFVSQSLFVDITKIAQEKYVAMDAEWLSSIFRSLIDNAYQHGGDDANVTVRCDLDRDSISNMKIQVHNDGRQISDAIAEKIFEPYFSTTPGESRRGIGLSIIKNLVELHGGTIKLMPSDSGVTFQIGLPLR
jgi:signal transduction histidine kinase